MAVRQKARRADVILHCGAKDASVELKTEDETARLTLTDHHEAIRTARKGIVLQTTSSGAELSHKHLFLGQREL